MKRYLVQERAKPSNRTEVDALSPYLAQVAGGVVLGISADKLCAHPLPPAQVAQRGQLSSPRSSSV